MAKAAGISLSKTHLYRLRGSNKRPAGSKPSQAATPATTKPSPSAETTSSAAPPERSGARIASGVKVVRTPPTLRKPRGARASLVQATRPSMAAATRGADAARKPRTMAASLEELLRAVAAEIGISKSLAILEEERASVRAILER